MSLCRLMVMDFMQNAESHNACIYNGAAGYDRYDLENGLAYAEEYSLRGLQTEPFYGFSLEMFAQWCKSRMDHDYHAAGSAAKGEGKNT